MTASPTAEPVTRSREILEVFISYNSNDRQAARRVEAELKKNGFSVWMDHELFAGEIFRETIKRHLDQALVAVVLWSSHSVRSVWVAEEADRALKAGKLVPAFIEDCDPPMPYGSIQTEKLTDWAGDPSNPRWLHFVKAIRQQREFQLRIRGETPTKAQPGQAATRPRRDALRHTGKITGIAIAIAVVLVLLRKEPSAPVVLPASVVRDPKPFFPFKDCPECPMMVALPGGTFVMGSPDSEAGRDEDEGPSHTVSVPSFSIGITETTDEEWAACVAQKACRRLEGNSHIETATGHPIVNVTWEDARAYVEWLTKRTRASYRLLNEREWEYAARAGGTGIHSFGEDASLFCRYENVADETLRRVNPQFTDIFPCNDGAAKTAPVRSYRPNAFGIFDMEGNVSEWTADCWSEELGKRGRQPPTSACRERAIRGGNWGLSPEHQRIANRMRNTPNTPLSSLGFRVARESF